jgi:centrin-3
MASYGGSSMMNNYNDSRQQQPVDRVDPRQPGTRSLPQRGAPSGSSGPAASGVGGSGTGMRPGGRFAPPVQNPGQAEPWDQISDEHRGEIIDCFQLFDMNKDDELDFSEFRYALQALGLGHVPRPELIAHFRARARPRPDWSPLPAVPGQPAPSQTPGVVDLRLAREAFQAVAAEYVAARDPREELLKTFGLFDKGGKGLITVDDLRTVVKELGEDVPENELRSMIEQFDVEDKGGVGREEFLGIFLSG